MKKYNNSFILALVITMLLLCGCSSTQKPAPVMKTFEKSDPSKIEYSFDGEN